MPEFSTAHSVIDVDKKISKDQLIRAIRFMIAAEYEAVQMYMQIAEATDDELAKKVIKSVSDEEIVHAGEFLALLKKLSPEEDKFYKEGEAEVESEVTGVKKQKEKDPEDIKKDRLKELFHG